MHPGRKEADEDGRRKAERGGHRKKGGDRDRKYERQRDGSEDEGLKAWRKTDKKTDRESRN